MNAVFFPQDVLDILVALEHMVVEGDQLVVQGYRYQLVEAVRVLQEVTTGEDPKDICGRVRETAKLTADGAEILGNSLLFEDNAYDIVPGMLASPAGEITATKREEDVLAELQAVEELQL